MLSGRSTGHTKPPLGVQIDWSSPLAQGLAVCCPFLEGSGRVSRNLVTGRMGVLGGSTLGWAGSPQGRMRNSSTLGTTATETHTHVTISRINCTVIARCFFRAFQPSSPFISGIWANPSGTPLIRMGDSGINPTQFNGVIGLTTVTDAENLEVNRVYNLAMRSGANERSLFVDQRKAATNTDAVGVGNFASSAWFTDSANNRTMDGGILLGLVYNRLLSDDDIKAIAASPYSMLMPPLTKKSWFVPSNLRSGSGTFVTEAATISGSGLHVPKFTGSGAFTNQTATLAGTGLRTVPNRTGSGTPSTQVTTLAGSGGASVPVTTGSGTPSTTAATASGTGTRDVPHRTGSGTLTTQETAWAGSGTADVPNRTGSGALSAEETAGSGAGTADTPSRTGSGALAAQEATGSGAGTADVPHRTGSGSPSTDAATADGVGEEVASSDYVATPADFTLEEVSAEGVGGATVPVEIPQSGFRSRFNLPGEERLYWPNATQPAKFPGRVVGLACVQTGTVTFSTNGGLAYRQKHLVAGSVYRPARAVTHFDYSKTTAVFYAVVVR